MSNSNSSNSSSRNFAQIVTRLDDYQSIHTQGQDAFRKTQWKLTQARHGQAGHAGLHLREDATARVRVAMAMMDSDDDDNYDDHDNSNPELVEEEDSPSKSAAAAKMRSNHFRLVRVEPAADAPRMRVARRYHQYDTTTTSKSKDDDDDDDGDDGDDENSTNKPLVLSDDPLSLLGMAHHQVLAAQTQAQATLERYVQAAQIVAEIQRGLQQQRQQH